MQDPAERAETFDSEIPEEDIVTTELSFEIQDLKLGECPLPIKIRSYLGQAEIGPDVHWFWQTHPRITFTKGLGLGSTIIDFGAGNGHFYSCGSDYLPIRNDQKFYAFDLFKGEHFDGYEDYQVGNFETEDLKWGAQSVDAVFASHVLEHLHDVRRFFEESYRVLKPGGLVFAETPSAFTAGFPSSEDLRAQGLPMIAANFFEDDTHVRTISNEQIAAVARLSGFVVQSQGEVRSDYFGDALIQYAQITQDVIYGMFGFWAKTGWAQYIVLRKPDDLDRYTRNF